MASGLRKIIRRARKRNNNSQIFSRRLNRFGPRLKVEELEERIAPAAVTLVPGEFTTYDGAAGADGVWDDANDFIIGISGGGGTDNSLASTVTDVELTILDNTTPVITDIGWSGAVTETLVLLTNGAIPSINLGTLTTPFPAGTTTLNIIILAGNDAADGTDVNEITFTDTTAATAMYSVLTFVAGTGGDPGDAGEPVVPNAAASIGTITMPTAATLTSIAPIIETGTGGTLAALVSTSTTATLVTNASADSKISAGTITSINWAGTVAPIAGGNFWIDADSNGGAGIGSLTLGTVILANTGLVTVDSDGGIGGLTITNGITLSGTTGSFLVDADDDGGNDDGFDGPLSLGGVTNTSTGAAAVTISGGGATFDSTISTGAISWGANVTAAFTITTVNNSNMSGLVTTGAITNSATAGGANITIAPGGTGSMAGFKATGLISNATGTTAPITIGGAGNTANAANTIELVGVTNNANADAADINFLGGSFGNIHSTLAIKTTGTNGDIAFTASGGTTTGSMGAVTVDAGGVQTSNANTAIAFSANDDMGDLGITGDVGGAGPVSFTANAGGTADTGNIGTVTVNSSLGSGAGTVAIAGVNIGDIVADNIGTGGGAVTFTADEAANTDSDAAGQSVVGTIGTTTVTNNVASAVGSTVTYNADDGVGDFSAGGDVAQAAALTFNTNTDGQDDVGAMGSLTAQTLGDADVDNDGDVDDPGPVVTINTNGGATDNTTVRPVGAIAATDGNAHLAITADGNVPLINVSGGDGANGNLLVMDLLQLNATPDPTNSPNFAGVTVADLAGENDLLALGGDWTIPGTMGPIAVGGSDVGDVMDLDGNLIRVYNGDDPSNGFAAFTQTADSNLVFTSGGEMLDTAGGGFVQANTLAASDLLTYTVGTVVYAVTVASNVTGNLVFDPLGTDGDPQVTITQLAGTSASDDIQITSSDGTEFDVGGITPASDNLPVRNIEIAGDLYGNLGSGTNGFGAVNLLIINGNANGNSFFGESLSGFATADNTLGLVGVSANVLDTLADGTDDIVIGGGSTFRFADAAGALIDVFNHRVASAGAPGSTMTLRGIDGSGNGDPLLASPFDPYTFTGNGSSAAQTDINGQVLSNAIDPNGLISDATADAAVISRILLSSLTGMSTDVGVREVDGTTDGSWLEFETNVGLVNLTTPLSTISVGIDDGGNNTDDRVETSIAGTANTRLAKDRLGGGEHTNNWLGLDPAQDVSDATAALGNFVARSMSAPTVDHNINIVVTGDSGPISLTGKANLETGDPGATGSVDPGGIVASDDATDGTGAAIAIGGNLQGAISIPGVISGGEDEGNDILIGIAIDGDNDGDYKAGEEPSGDVNANITIGHAPDTNIVVAGNINNNIVVTGVDNHLENPGLDNEGDLNGVKANGDIGQLGEDVIVVAGDLNWVISDAALNSGIFFGGGDTLGDNADGFDITIEGVGINGPAVLGGSSGIESLNIIDHEAFGDVGDTDTLSHTGGGSMVVQWAAGGLGDGTDTLGDVYAIGSTSDLTVATPNGDSMNIGDIFLLDDGSVNFTSPGNIGVVVAADDATVPSSEALQDLITTTHDVVNSPTSLDTASGDQAADINYSGSISAENAGGVIAEGFVEVDGDFEVDDNFGYIVALNGSIDVDDVTDEVHAGVSIGHIVASTDIDGKFISEGTLGVDTAFSSLASLTADLTSFGLSGVPAWFLNGPGGVLSEVGDIGNNEDMNNGLWTGNKSSDINDDVTAVGFVAEDILTTSVDTEAVFSAAGVPTEVQDNMFWGGSQAMGTFYVPAGTMSADINSGGDFGGIQVPAGQVWVELTVPLTSSIDRIIAPQFFDNFVHAVPEGGVFPTSDSWWNVDRVNVLVIEGENVVVAGTALNTDSLDVSVTGATTLAIVDGTDIKLVDGLAAGSSLIVGGDLNELLVDGNWDGTVDINSNAQADTDGEVDDIIVNGNVSGTAVLTAFNFGDLRVEGTNAAAGGGTLSGRDSDVITNLAGDSQTLFLDAGRKVSAEYDTIFGKITEVEIAGRGNASLVSVNGSFDADDRTDLRDLKRIERDSRNGRGNASLPSDGTAHLGEVSVLGSKLNFRDVVVGGDLDSLNAPKNVSNLYVSGDANNVGVGGNINRAFIGGSAGDFAAKIARNVNIADGANSITAFKMANSNVNGTTTTLNIGTRQDNGAGRDVLRGALINSQFENVITANVVRSVRSNV